MDDLSAILTQVMSNPDAVQQIQSMASSLGLGGMGPAPQPYSFASQPQPPPPQQQMPDLSALLSMLGGAGGAPQPPPPPQQQMPDLSALLSMLGGAGGAPQPPPPPQQQMPDLSALLSMLSGGAAATTKPAAAPAGPNLDLGTLVKLSRAMSSLQSNRTNIDLLLALKPRLKEDRAKKVDDAIRVMQIIQFLPLVKESGLFGEMDNILGGIGNFIGGSGLGGLFGGGGGNTGGASGLLGNLGNLIRR